MNTKEFHPDEDERIERVITEVTSILGTKGIAQLLLDGDPEHGVEPIELEQAREDLEVREPEPEVLKAVIHSSGKVDDLESFIITGRQDKISRDNATHGHSRAKMVEQEMQGLPGWLAEDLLYSEIDLAEGGTFDRPDNYEQLLGLRQIEAEWFGKGQNRQERKELWDQVLKFTHYRVEINFDGSKFVRMRWCPKRSTAHNEVLREARREHGDDIDIDNIETTAQQLFMPDTDPLGDLEEFVYRW